MLFISRANCSQIRIVNEDLDEDNELIVVCDACPEGTYSNEQSDDIANCTKLCTPGYCPKNITCPLCEPGTYNDQINATDCRSCPPGFVSEVSGSINCTACGAGYVNNSINTACNPCPSGYFTRWRNDGHCYPCAPGSYSPSASGFCTQCPPGTFNSDWAQSGCTPCGVGKWNPEQASTDSNACLSCPVGYYCPSDSTSEPVICPANYYCQPGSSKPSRCLPLFRAPDGSEKCTPTLWLYVIIGVSSFVLFVIFVIAIVRRARKAEQEIIPSEIKLCKKV